MQGEKEIVLADNEHYKRSERKSGAFIRSFAIPEAMALTSLLTFEMGVNYSASNW